jgi:hypothetical protein
MTSDDFDRLTLFVAIYEEMKHEPYFSPDVHEFLEGHGPDGSLVSKGNFVHPVFLKSAVLPFRKLWLGGDESSFLDIKGASNGIRDIVFEWIDHIGFAALGMSAIEYSGAKSLFTRYFDFQLEQNVRSEALPVSHSVSEVTVREILDIWINAEVVHVSKKIDQKKKPGQKDRIRFETLEREMGKVEFEYLFRYGLRSVGLQFQEFGRKLAIPLWDYINQKGDFKPSFHAQFALTHNPSVPSNSSIQYSDYFWHLNKESPGDTLSRLIRRDRLSSLHLLLQKVFVRKTAAAEALLIHEIFDQFIGHNSATIEFTNLAALVSNARGTACAKSYSHLSGGGTVRYEIHKDLDGCVTVFADPECKELFQQLYTELRTEFLRSRNSQAARLGEDQW